MFADVWTALQTAILKLTDDFPEGSVSLGDFSILESGLAQVAIITPGPFIEPDVHGAALTIRGWIAYIDLFYRLTQQRAIDWAAFVALRDKLVGTLEMYPSLDGTAGITRVRVAAEVDAIEVFDEDDNGPFFIYQQLTAGVQETATVTGGEYGS